MAERFHCEKDGKWVGYGADTTTFRREDVKHVSYESNEEGQWNVVVVLKDGRKICPDYTSWDSVYDAMKEAQRWRYTLL